MAARLPAADDGLPVLGGQQRRLQGDGFAPDLGDATDAIVLGVLITRDHFDARMAAGAIPSIVGVLLIGLQPAVLTAALARIRSRR